MNRRLLAEVDASRLQDDQPFFGDGDSGLEDGIASTHEGDDLRIELQDTRKMLSAERLENARLDAELESMKTRLRRLHEAHTQSLNQCALGLQELKERQPDVWCGKLREVP